MNTSMQMCNQIYFSKGRKKEKNNKHNSVYSVIEARKLTEQGELPIELPSKSR